MLPPPVSMVNHRSPIISKERARDGTRVVEESGVPLDGLPTELPDSRQRYLARTLRHAIVTGRLAPGERLVERDLSERFGVSRGPVREALRELASEGLVRSEPYRGTRIVGITQVEVEEVLVPIRLVLERFALARLLSAPDEGALRRLDALVAEMRAAAAGDDEDRLVEAHAAFHEAIIERSGHAYCLQVWRSIAPRVRGYFHRDSRRHRSLDDTVREHVELLAAVRSGRRGDVLALLDRHVHTTVELDRAAPAGAEQPS